MMAWVAIVCTEFATSYVHVCVTHAPSQKISYLDSDDAGGVV